MSAELQAKRHQDKQKFSIHTIRSGETLYKIARENGISVTDILKVNPSLTENQKLKLGQSIRIPNKNSKKSSSKTKPEKNSPVSKSPAKSEKTSGNNKYHIVKKGQTLYGISKIYHVNVNDLKKWNKLKDNNLKLGSKIIVQNPSIKERIPASEPKDEVKEEIAPESHADSGKVTDTGTEEQDMEKPDIQANDNVSQKELIKLYREKAASGTIKTVKGTGAPMSTTLGAMENTYFVMHKTLVIGTVVKIKNLVNSRVIYAKVIGKLPETDENKHVIVRYTAGIKKDLQLQNGKCYVQVEYAE